MALFHFSLGHIKRTVGHTAIAAAAYRAGEKLYDAYYGETQDYSRKKGVVTTKIYTPDYVPERLRDRQTLWTEVEFNEHRKDAQLAYSLDIALQNELTLEENIELLDRFVTEEMVPIGMIVDVAIHNPDRGKHGIPNPHGHLSAPMRPFLESGEWGIKQHMEYVLDENGERIRKPNGKYKTIAVSETGWNDPALLEHWRERWAELVNQKFEEKGLTCRIDHRSNEARGITDAPQVHEGSAVRRMEAKGVRTDKGTWNRWVSKTNDMIRHILSAIREISGWMKEMCDEIKRLEDPTVSDMVMRYHSHRDEVANTYTHGVQNAKKTNMKQMNKACNYLMENNITTPEELETLLATKEKSLAGKDKDIEDLKKKAADYRELITALENYEKYKPVFDQSQKIHFKGKKEQFQKEHRKELNQNHKAKRKLEPYLVEGSMDAARAVWEEKIEAIEADITQKSEDADLTTLKDELEILKYIKDSIDYCINPNGGSGGEGGNSGGSGQPIKPDKDAEVEKLKKQAEEQAQAEAQRQQAEQLSRQAHHTSQKEEKSERISLKERIRDKQEIVREYDRTHQYVARDNKRKRDENNLS